MSGIAKIILKPGKEQSPKRFHPWIFSGAVKEMDGKAEEGDLVEVYSNSNEFLGIGHCQPGSIAVRVISFQKTEIDGNFWKAKIENAYNCRKAIGLAENENTNAYRLVYAEGDGLPGLIIDYYNGTAVMQAHSVGMHLAKENIVNALKAVYGD